MSFLRSTPEGYAPKGDTRRRASLALFVLLLILSPPPGAQENNAENPAQAPSPPVQEDPPQPAPPGENPPPIRPIIPEDKVNRPALPLSDNLEKQRRAITEEADRELVKLDINDTEVSLIMNGYWKGALSGSMGLSIGPLGAGFASTESPILFTQEADMTLSLWIRKKWFLEVSFLDEYDINTYRAGYQGSNGDTVQYFGIGNTGLDFPVFPYLDLGGDSPASLGAYGRFAFGDLQLHTLVRYDAAAREERIFVGSRERSYSSLSPADTIRGRSFILPDKNISSAPLVFLEDPDEGTSGPLGRKWRQAKMSEYAVSAAQGILELASVPEGMVAVSYPGMAANLGNYGSAADYTNENNPFLGRVRNYFGGSVQLDKYPQPGQHDPSLTGTANIPATLTLAGVRALVIYEPGTFSPFERLSRYMSPSSNSEDAAFIRPSSGERIPGFEVLPLEDALVSLEEALNSYGSAAPNRSVYELHAGSSGGNRRDFTGMWPLLSGVSGIALPELYLPGQSPSNADVAIRFTNYGASGAFNIGVDVVPGSVQVFRGGIQDSRISYNESSGVVQLAFPVGFNEEIRISYLKRSEERRLGSLAAGLGLTYKPEDKHFSAEAALGMRWNVSQENYTENGAGSPGTAGLAGRVSWDYGNFKASVSSGLGYEQPHTTGLYRAAGMEGASQIVMNVSALDGFISETPVQSANSPPGFSLLDIYNRVNLVYRNYRDTNALGISTLHPIEWNAPLVNGLNRPYPASDSILPSEIMVAEWSELPASYWTGFQIPLGADADLLEKASSLVIPMRFYGVSATANLKIVAQIGVLAEEGRGGGADAYNLIVEKELWNGLVQQGEIDKVIRLLDTDRSKLRDANQLRILIINESGSAIPGGRVLFAKPYSVGSSWRAIHVDAGTISAAADTDAAAARSITAWEVSEGGSSSLASRYSDEIKRLHSFGGLQQVLEINWENLDTGDAGADGRTALIPLSNYRELAFFFRTPSVPFDYVRFIIAKSPSSLDKPRETELDVSIPSSSFSGIPPGVWTKIKIRYRENRVEIDGRTVEARVSYNSGVFRENKLDNPDQSSYSAVFVKPASYPPDGSAGSFAVDEICLGDPSPSYRLNTGGAVEYSVAGAILAAKNIDIISDFSVETAMESAVQGDPFSQTDGKYAGLQSRSAASVSLLGARAGLTLAFTGSTDTSYWSAGHSLSRAFGPLSFSESFNASPQDRTMDHAFSLSLNTIVKSAAEADIRYENQKVLRWWKANIGMDSVSGGRPGFNISADLKYTENPQHPDEEVGDYGRDWIKTWQYMGIDDGSGSFRNTVQRREASGIIGFSLNRSKIGFDIKIQGNSEASIPQAVTNSASTAALSVPFMIGAVRATIRGERSFTRMVNYADRSLSGDLDLYASSLSDSLPLWSSPPLYSLFDPNLAQAMDKTTAAYGYSYLTQNSRFRDLLGLSFQFPERYDPWALIIPSSLFTQLDRSLEQRLDTALDTLTLSSSVGFSAINLFGAMGVRPLFRFYRNDEIRHSLSSVFTFPRGEEYLWRLQAEQQLAFFGFKESQLSISNNVSVGFNGWMDNVKIIWEVYEDKTLLSSIYLWAMGKISAVPAFPALGVIAKSEAEKLRRETLELVFDNTGDYPQYTFAVQHESIVRIIGRLNLTGLARLNVDKNDYTETLSLVLTLGASLTVSF